MTDARNDVIGSLSFAGAIVLLALGASFARQQGYIDQDTVLRLVIGANGLMIAYFGNRAPKKVVPNACARQVTRFGGWSMVISGLIYTGLWVFAPISAAITLGTGVVAAGMVATLGYCLHLRSRSRAQAQK